MTEEGESARPYICLLIILVFVFTPSVRPFWCGRVSAAVAAWMSRSRPRVNECRWGRSAACASVIHCRSLASLPGSGFSRPAKERIRQGGAPSDRNDKDKSTIATNVGGIQVSA